MAPTVLPEEIISMICSEIARDKGFGTLYSCAQSAKLVADSALRVMYQYHELSPAFDYTEDDEQYFRSWAALWRSIICSSLSPTPTYRPYCRYLRILDFRNFKDMLENIHFRAVKKSFFAKPLDVFLHQKKAKRGEMPDPVPIINHVGEAIVPKAFLLEEISGHLSVGYLSRWVAQTPKLKRMVLWDGQALGEGAGSAVARHCEHFAALSIHGWFREDADDVFSLFLKELKPDTIEYLQFISINTIAGRSFEALGRHGGLKKLKLNNLCPAAMRSLNGLRACTRIEVLSLEGDFASTRLEENNNDVFVDVIAWLSSCHQLRDITLRKFVDGPAILAAVAIAPGVKWTKLCLEDYSVRNPNSASFHTALTQQKALEELSLSGSGDDALPQDFEIMVSSISQLSKLTKLTLRQISDEFDMTHVSNLVLNLPHLEEFTTGGQELSSDLLLLLTNLRSLKVLTLFALTQFDFDSMFDFVSQLDPKTQKGFSLSLMAVDQQFALEREQQQVISDMIQNRVGGSFGMWTRLTSLHCVNVRIIIMAFIRLVDIIFNCGPFTD